MCPMHRRARNKRRGYFPLRRILLFLAFSIPPFSECASVWLADLNLQREARLGQSEPLIPAKFAAALKSAAHNFCVVRRCFLNGEPNPPPGSDIFPVTAIDPGAGRGFIAEENTMAKVTTGIKTTNNPAIDLIFWNNQMNVVRYGIDIFHNDVGSAAVGRLVILENAINLARISGTDCTAIRVLGDVNEQNFKQVIVRKNVVAPDPESSGTTLYLGGIVVKSTTNAIIENNVLDQCDALPLYYTYCATMKAFNNQKPDGTLLRALESITGRYLMELQDFTEDSLMTF